MTSPTRSRALAVALAAPLLMLPGCGPDTHGVNLVNSTDRVVLAEFLTIDTAGEMTPYGRAIVQPGDQFTHRMEDAPRGQRSRVRLVLEGETPDYDNWVLMSLSEEKTRYYDLRLIDGRLRAVEQKRGRPTPRTTGE